MTDIYSCAKQHYDWAVNLRRYFHVHPELSGQEYKTQEKICQELQLLGVSFYKAAKTGVIAEIKGGNPGKTIAIRTDIDALPLQDACGQDYQSENKGACHACGHDGHMAILFGTIRILNDVKADLAGTFRFLFQPSEEEFPSGAKELIAAGALDGIDAIIGAHIWQPVPLGTIGISYGNLMAAPDKFQIKITGKGGHGSMPEQTIDPILTAAQIILGLNTIVSRNIDPLDLGVVSVGSIHAGQAFNIIPETAVIEGTVRSFSEKIQKLIFNRIETITQGICAGNGATYTIDTVMERPAVINHPAYTKAIKDAVDLCESNIKAKEIAPVMSGEDFSYYLQQVPGAFFFIGTGSAKSTYPHHHPKFDIDEECILYGMEVMARAAILLAKS
ncbi:amidohydrolase [Propionispira arboris]|uniref:Amidohydrolase n=1 Tax=Propionispira arboris TaxID=84035 RepID=A0A1H6X441_9FIRM|nr:amidohydrolase [Propionispira arboris]SEJ22284.1 amidohydrolase [Propionispira arboris]